MTDGTYLVITSIAGATPGLEQLARDAQRHGVDFVLVGDGASPPWTELDGCDFYSLERQRELPFELAAICPVGHYARKNLGFLIAMRAGAPVIVETDDDTVAGEQFWAARTRRQSARSVAASGWVNAYRYFSEAPIWPRGFPIDAARAGVPQYDSLAVGLVDAPIQQGLVDDDPDVDAIYRMLFDLPFRFERGPAVALSSGTWCPFNSQNTTWWRDAFPLLYLPASCSFRMTDIWRSFVAQRIAWENGWSVLFHEATVRQLRNAHDLNRDFADEVPGYLDNRAMCAALDALQLERGSAHISTNMRRSYELLVERGWLDASELTLLDAWLVDVENACEPAAAMLQ
jgi:hypothetical protein